MERAIKVWKVEHVQVGGEGSGTRQYLGPSVNDPSLIPLGSSVKLESFNKILLESYCDDTLFYYYFYHSFSLDVVYVLETL